MNSCPLCRNGELHPGSADKTMTIGESTLVVKEVPALICDTCGERYFNSDITQRLLDLARDVHSQGVLIDVRRYAA